MGFGIDPEKNPENTEHFGMTTLEAMSSGCIPLVVPYGGQREIVEDSQFFFETMDELCEKMKRFEAMPSGQLHELSKTQRERSSFYAEEKFVKEIESLLN